ncbi:Alpha/Beta hydrolase protein [Camillea tinctor]|nr:Alpha/Beta hydrolase protein [Camillea tinctor]
MFDGFEEFAVKVESDPEVTIHGRRSTGLSCNLPPLLLLHGFPQSLHIWHRIAPQLIHNYAVVMLDLRGYGGSSKPAHISAYAKSAMARDCVAVMNFLGFESFFVCAHDRGARVAHKLCADHPERVRKAIFLDICPTLAMYTTTNIEFPRAYFHWFFLIQKEPLPESMISANPRRFVELFVGGRQEGGLQIFDQECLEYYIKILECPEAVHAMCQDYRASATLDLDEARDDLSQGKLIRCPLMILWAKRGVIEKCFDAVTEWREVTDKKVPVTGNSIQSGHYIPEHAPDDVVSAVLDFLI